MPRIPAKIAAASVYVDGAQLPEMAEFEPPEVNFEGADVEAFGLGGTVKTVLVERLEAMECTFKPRSVSGGALRRLLRFGQSAEIDVRFVVSTVDSLTRAARPVGCRCVLRAQPMSVKTPGVKTGSDDASEVKLAVSYYRLVVDGVTVVEADPLNFLLTVDGEDLLAATRLLL